MTKKIEKKMNAKEMLLKAARILIGLTVVVLAVALTVALVVFGIWLLGFGLFNALNPEANASFGRTIAVGAIAAPPALFVSSLLMQVLIPITKKTAPFLEKIGDRAIVVLTKRKKK